MGSATARATEVGPVVAATPTPPTPGPIPTVGLTGARFYTSPLHRTIITDLSTNTIRWLDRYTFGRSAAYTLNVGATFSGSVHSDEPRISIPYNGDGFNLPALAEGVRLLYDFRQEDPTGLVPWTCRFAGIILNVTDRTDADNPISDYVAHDPWRYLYAVPVVGDDGSRLTTDGTIIGPEAGSIIAANMLANALNGTGDTLQMLNLIDAGPDYGGTSFWSGTIETSPSIANWPVKQGTSIGQAWTDLTSTGTMDIVLTPIYDPINRPGYCAELSIYSIDGTASNGAGSTRYDAVFGWDTVNRSLLRLERQIDGTQRANELVVYAGVGGIPGSVLEDATSIDTYGQYWSQQFQPQNQIKTNVGLLAQQQLLMRKNGLRTYTIQPAPERGPLPFTGWYLGDRVFPFATDRFREAISIPDGVRIQGFGLTISDDAMETVTPALVTPDGF